MSGKYRHRRHESNSGIGQKGTGRAIGGGASGGVRKVDEGLAGVRKPGGVGGVESATRSMGGGCTAGEAGETLDFLDGRGEGEDIGVCGFGRKMEAYIDPIFLFFLFFLFCRFQILWRMFKFTDSRPFKLLFLLLSSDYDPALNLVRL